MIYIYIYIYNILPFFKYIDYIYNGFWNLNHSIWKMSIYFEKQNIKYTKVYQIMQFCGSLCVTVYVGHHDSRFWAAH